MESINNTIDAVLSNIDVVSPNVPLAEAPICDTGLSNRMLH
jgi:hypothetical protein